MLECIDAIHLTAETARRGADPLAEALAVWQSAFQAAGVLADVDEPAGALRVIVESCRTLTEQLSKHLATGP